MHPPEDNRVPGLDDAVARRLRKLRQRPLDKSGLSDRVQAAISAGRSTQRAARLFSPWRAIAASLLVIGAIVAVFLTASAGPVLASPSELSRIHRDSVSVSGQATTVGSMPSARQTLQAQWKDCPQLPECPLASVASCHVQRLAGKQLACVLLRIDGHLVTLAVARAGDMALPTSPVVRRFGVDYHIESFGNVRITVTRRNGLWLCVMGELSVERLVEIAASLKL